MRPGRKLYARHTMRLTLIPRFPYGYFAIYRKDTDKRARNFEACFCIFHSECRVFSHFIAKIPTNEREIAKLASIFFTASAGYFRDLSQRYEELARKRQEIGK